MTFTVGVIVLVGDVITPISRTLKYYTIVILNVDKVHRGNRNRRTIFTKW